MTKVLGYTTLNEEITVDRLPVEGTIPAWLEGSLLRNGPAKFEAGPDTFRHWFDGFAMLHRFTFHNGNVSYAKQKKGKVTLVICVASARQSSPLSPSRHTWQQAPQVIISPPEKPLYMAQAAAKRAAPPVGAELASALLPRLLLRAVPPRKTYLSEPLPRCTQRDDRIESRCP